MTNIEKTNVLAGQVNYLLGIANDMKKYHRSEKIMEHVATYEDKVTVSEDKKGNLTLSYGHIQLIMRNDRGTSYILNPTGKKKDNVLSTTDASAGEFKNMIIDYIEDKGYEWDVEDTIPQYIPLRNYIGDDENSYEYVVPAIL